MIELTTPISEEQIRGLKVGDEVGITGVIFTGRDEVHKYLHEGGELPEGVSLWDTSRNMSASIVFRALWPTWRSSSSL